MWLRLERTRVPDGSAIAKAIDYSLNHWAGLGRFLLDGAVPIDNNHCENRIRRGSEQGSTFASDFAGR